MLDVVAVNYSGQKRNRHIYQINFTIQGAPATATVEFAPANLVKRRIVSAKYNPISKEDMERIIEIEKTYMPIMNVALKKDQKDWLMDAIESSEIFSQNQ